MRVLEVQNDPAVPIGALAAPLLSRGIQLDLWMPWRHEAPAAIDDWDGIIALGGTVNPDQDDNFEWLRTERALLAQAIALRLPILGICLGAELLTQVVGGRVYRLPEPVIGWTSIYAADSAGDDRLWCVVPERFQGFEWHSYGFQPPPGATILATGRAGSVEAFRYHDHIWAVQFHPEADHQIILDWINRYQGDLRSAGKDPGVLASETTDLAHASRAQACDLGRRFALVVERTAVERRSA